VSDSIDVKRYSVRPWSVDRRALHTPGAIHTCAVTGRPLPHRGWSVFRDLERVSQDWAAQQPELALLANWVDQLNRLGEPGPDAHLYGILHRQAFRSQGPCPDCMSDRRKGPEALGAVERRGDWEIAAARQTTTGSPLCVEHAELTDAAGPLGVVLDEHYGRQRRRPVAPPRPVPRRETDEERVERAVRRVAAIISRGEPEQLALARAHNLVAALALVFDLRGSLSGVEPVAPPQGLTSGNGDFQ
jgi:hypothetical protein